MTKSYLKASMTIGLLTALAGTTHAQDNGPANPQVIAAADPSPGGFHRHSEGSAVQLDNGRILLSWSRFHTTSTYTNRDDNSPGTIVWAYSDDLGVTWSVPQPMPVGTTVTDGWNVMQSAFLKLDDRLQLYYSVRERFPNSSRPTGKFLIESTDNGATWSDRRLVTPNNVVITGPNDRMLQLSSGRIILPVHRGTDGPRVAWSDDKGATWAITNTLAYNDPWPGETEGPKVHEPTVIQRNDGSLYMLARTTRGQFAHGTSADGGQTWTTLEPSGIPAMTSPPYMRKLDDGRVLLLWNRPTDAQITQWPRTMPGYLKRHTLMGAISTDDAHTWSAPIVMMNDGGTSAFMYPWLLELAGSDQMLLFASRSPDDINNSSLVMRRLSKWALPAQQAGKAQLWFDPGDGAIWLDVGSGVRQIEISGSGLSALGAFHGVQPQGTDNQVSYAAATDLAFAKQHLGTIADWDVGQATFRWQLSDGTWASGTILVVPEPVAGVLPVMAMCLLGRGPARIGH